MAWGLTNLEESQPATSPAPTSTGSPLWATKLIVIQQRPTSKVPAVRTIVMYFIHHSRVVMRLEARLHWPRPEGLFLLCRSARSKYSSFQAISNWPAVRLWSKPYMRTYFTRILQIAVRGACVRVGRNYFAENLVGRALRLWVVCVRHRVCKRDKIRKSGRTLHMAPGRSPYG